MVANAMLKAGHFMFFLEVREAMNEVRLRNYFSDIADRAFF